MPAGPSKRKLIAFSLLIGLLLSGGLCVVLDQLEKAHRVPELSDLIGSLRETFPGFRTAQEGGAQ